MSLLFKRIPENRLAHLLGSRRAHRALILVEGQAALLERQAASGKQAADLRLGIGDDPFIVPAVHAARQCCIKVVR